MNCDYFLGIIHSNKAIVEENKWTRTPTLKQSKMEFKIDTGADIM